MVGPLAHGAAGGSASSPAGFWGPASTTRGMAGIRPRRSSGRGASGRVKLATASARVNVAPIAISTERK